MSYGAFPLGVGGIINDTFLADAKLLEDVVPGWSGLLEGRDECLRECIVFTDGEFTFLSPDTLPIAGELFPDWINRSQGVMTALGLALITISDAQSVTARELAIAELVSDWAKHSEQWHVGIGVPIRVFAPWCLKSGSFVDLEDEIEAFLPHTEGMQHVVLLGHRAAMLTQSGRLEDALRAHEEQEEWLNPRAPRGARRLRHPALLSPRVVSIHAPRAGRDAASINA